MAKADYNVVVIGAGAAGLTAAYIAASLQAKVALIERGQMGGDCLNTGCIPSKALLRSAQILAHIRRSREFGLHAAAEGDFAAVMERTQNIIRRVAPHDSAGRYRSLGVECISGDAQILSPHAVRVDSRVLNTQNIIIATGARPFVPDLPGLATAPYLTSETIWNLREQPRRLAVLGGGPIGCELAQGFARLGARVTLIQRRNTLLPKEDPEIGQALEQRFTAEGIQVLLNNVPHEITRENGVFRLSTRENAAMRKIEFDHALIALGRTPVTRGLGLENTGATIRPDGGIAVDEYLRAGGHNNIFACGDVTGPYQFTHTAGYQGWICAVNALFRPWKKFKTGYSAIPWCTFTDPEVARVGLNETEAAQRGAACDVTRFHLDELDRAITDGENTGLIKVLTRKGSDKILGVTAMGYHAGDTIAEYVLAMQHGLGLNKILNTIHIYPTMAEANKFAAGEWRKRQTPPALLNWLRRFHAWRR